MHGRVSRWHRQPIQNTRVSHVRPTREKEPCAHMAGCTNHELRIMAEKIKKQDGQSASFNIPKIKRSASQAVLRKVDVASRDVQDLMKEFDRSFLDVTYKDQWKLTRVEFVDNNALEKAYRKKRAELKDSGRNARELLELLSYMPFKKSSFAIGVAKEGLLVKSRPNHYLGDCSFGVHVCKHADPVLRFGESVREAHIMVFKITPGRCKAVVSNKASGLEPTPNYDCHVSSVQPKSTDTYMDQLSRSQIYLFEYDENAEACKRPRHCLPYAVLHLEMKRQVEKQKTHLPVNPNLISSSAASAGWTSSTRWTVPEALRSQAQEANSVACKSLTKITAQEREPCNKSASLKMSAEAEFLRSPSYQEVGVPKSSVFASLNSVQGNPDRVKGDTIQTCDTGGKTFFQLGKGNDDRAIGEETKEVIGTKYQSAVCLKRDPRLRRSTSEDADNKINSDKDGLLARASDRNNFQEPETDSLGSAFNFHGESKIAVPFRYTQ
ncbi:protein TASOR-like isoform X1 [Pomacea canaliculata]|uniref:protein TASOR-like isoform X1 n=2 Tax=Pomacea canaliculata TaxID=400727 RepID=UPI000D734A10|nr:protein TASOR-like isoform X1 [Pomacea canaliculata]